VTILEGVEEGDCNLTPATDDAAPPPPAGSDDNSLGQYGHAPIRSNTSIRVYTMANTDTDMRTQCVGVPATCNIRPGRSLRERSLHAMGGTCRPLPTNKLARSVSFMTG